uniref:Uncharacterized protein n=1 Tax=Micrurus surinamensis TaxID=129470 RepID=A0A2D4NRG5_MICSU
MKDKLLLPNAAIPFETLFPMLQTDSFETFTSSNVSSKKLLMYVYKKNKYIRMNQVCVCLGVCVQARERVECVRENSDFHSTNIQENILSSNHCRHAADLFARVKFAFGLIIMKVSGTSKMK